MIKSGWRSPNSRRASDASLAPCPVARLPSHDSTQQTPPMDVGTTDLGDNGFEPDGLLECSGNARATWDAVGVVARAGRVALVGMGGDEVRLPLSFVQDRELTITGAFRYANTWPTAVTLAASGQV